MLVVTHDLPQSRRLADYVARIEEGRVTPQGPAADLLGACKIAGFAESLYVAATMIDGESRQSQYDASGLTAFVLAPE